MKPPVRLLTQLHGARLEAVELEESGTWWLRFSGQLALNVPDLWRLTENGDVYATSADHDQMFGLEQPFDSLAILRRLVNVPVLQAEVATGTTDLLIKLEKGLSLQVLTTSAGYEGWSLVAAGRHRFIARGPELLELPSDAFEETPSKLLI